MLDLNQYDRIEGESSYDWILRKHRRARQKKMQEARYYLQSIAASGMPYNEDFVLAVEALVDVIDDILEEQFV